MTTVFVAAWDVRNAGTGVEIFATREGAIDATLSWASGVIETGEPESYRAELEENESLAFEDLECWYSIEECEVQL